MKIEVEEQTKRFYLAFNQWRPQVGHGINVGDYSFFAVPTPEGINVSEATSGLKMFVVPLTIEVALVTATKEESLKFLYEVGKIIRKKINKQNNFHKILEEERIKAISRLGPMPEIEIIDTDWVFEKESDILS